MQSLLHKEIYLKSIQESIGIWNYNSRWKCDCNNISSSTTKPNRKLQNGDETNDVIHNHYVVLETNELCGSVDHKYLTEGFNPSVADLLLNTWRHIC